MRSAELDGSTVELTRHRRAKQPYEAGDSAGSAAPAPPVWTCARAGVERRALRGHLELEFEDPARVFKIEGDTHKIVTAFDSSVTEGGIRGKPGAARPLMRSVILQSVVLRIRLFRPQRG